MSYRFRSTCLRKTRQWRIACAVLAGIGSLTSPIYAQATGLVKTLGGTGVAGYTEGPHGTSQFHTPVGLAVRSDGVLFVADRDNNAVRTINLTSTNASTFKTFNLPAPIAKPVALTFDSKSHLYVASAADGSITELDFFGNYRRTLHPDLTAGPITAVAMDRSDNLYIAEQGGVVIRLDATGAVDAALQAPVGGTHEFRGVAVTDDGIVFVSDAAAQVIWKFTAGTGELFAGTLNQSGSAPGERGYGRLNNPQQIAIGPNRSVVIADRGNQQVRVASCDGVITTLYGIDPADWTYGPAPQFEPGWYDSPVGPQFSEVREPIGIATDGAGNVYDTEVYYHLVRGTTGTLGFPAACNISGPPSPTNAPPALVLSPNSGFYPNGVTITVSASNSVSGFSRDVHLFYTTNGQIPTKNDLEITIGADGQGHLNLPGPIDLANLRVRAFLGDIGGSVAAASPTIVPTPILVPNSGYYPMGIDITITSTNGFPDGTILYYTVDGSLPTTNSPALNHDGSKAILSWHDGTRDLRSLKVKAVLGPNEGSVVAGKAVSFPGQPEVQGQVGVPPARNGYRAGIGSFYILPIVANLRDDQQLQSLQFAVELSPLPGSPQLQKSDLVVLPMSTNDFIPVLPATTAPPDNTIAIARGGSNRLALAYVNTNSGFNVTAGYATVALLGIQFRAQDDFGNTATVGGGYKLHISGVTGTSRGVQQLLPLNPMDDIIIHFENIQFREGDTFPAYWYNAGDFGNGILDNGDFKNAVFAGFGFGRPFPLSDAFAAMDVYRIGVLENVVEYNDAATILRRTFNFESPDVFRMRNDDGEWQSSTTRTPAPVPQPIHALSAPVVAWHRDATIAGGVVDRAVSSQAIGLPVYVKTAPGISLSGLQFVADVVPVDGAPAVSGVTFFPSSLIAPPKFYGNELPNGAILPSTVFARWDDLSTPFQGTVLLGYVQFVTPSTVQAGQHYNIVFHDAGGAFVDPNTDVLTGYLFDGIHGEVWPWQAAPDASSTNVRISDDWKTHFFGSMSAPDANPNDDPDGDGFTNIEEYLAGSDPNTPDWHVKSDNGHVSFRWVGRQGQNYTVQRTSDFISWTTVSGRMTGRDAFLEYDEPTTPGKAQFYRLNLQ